ncbi:hypothetical protein Y592_09185 [Thermosipho sp. 1070]|nr:hypothetical protein Y592_09185 [Thermosipho sp. 1070]
MDTNATKNRSGEFFGKLCQRKIAKLITLFFIPSPILSS